MVKALVKFFVYSDIEQEIEYEPGEENETILKRAIGKAIEEQPLVSWEFDENSDHEVIKN